MPAMEKSLIEVTTVTEAGGGTRGMEDREDRIGGGRRRREERSREFGATVSQRQAETGTVDYSREKRDIVVN